MVGAGGHAGVLWESFYRTGVGEIVGLVAREVTSELLLQANLEVVPDEEMVNNFPADDYDLVNGIGFLPGSELREQLFYQYKGLGYSFAPVYHPTAIISPFVRLMEGVQVLAGAVVGPNSCVGPNVIINSRANVDHDSEIGAHVHIAPGATLCGGVSVGEGSFVGAGSVIVHGVKLPPESFVKANSLMKMS